MYCLAEADNTSRLGRLLCRLTRLEPKPAQPGVWRKIAEKALYLTFSAHPKRNRLNMSLNTNRMGAFRVCVTRRQVLRLEAGSRPLRLRCLDGAVWITQRGRPGDHILAPGDTYLADSSKKAFIQVLKDSRLEFIDADKDLPLSEAIPLLESCRAVRLVR